MALTSSVVQSLETRPRLSPPAYATGLPLQRERLLTDGRRPWPSTRQRRADARASMTHSVRRNEQQGSSGSASSLLPRPPQYPLPIPTTTAPRHRLHSFAFFAFRVVVVAVAAAVIIIIIIIPRRPSPSSPLNPLDPAPSSADHSPPWMCATRHTIEFGANTFQARRSTTTPTWQGPHLHMNFQVLTTTTHRRRRGADNARSRRRRRSLRPFGSRARRFNVALRQVDVIGLRIREEYRVFGRGGCLDGGLN